MLVKILNIWHTSVRFFVSILQNVGEEQNLVKQLTVKKTFKIVCLTIVTKIYLKYLIFGTLLYDFFVLRTKWKSLANQKWSSYRILEIRKTHIIFFFFFAESIEKIIGTSIKNTNKKIDVYLNHDNLT
jgi:hypothetical protein